MSVRLIVEYDITRVLSAIERLIVRTRQQQAAVMELAATETAQYLISRLQAYRVSGELINAVSWESSESEAIVRVEESRMMKPHARFFFEGTRPSPGRYIPAIQKRYSKLIATGKGRQYRSTRTGRYASIDRIGWHPGTPSHYNIWTDTQDFLDRNMIRWLTQTSVGMWE